MIRRFSFYGFLKDQRYFEPFIVLIFLEKGLSYFQIGMLIAFREITINLLEVPTGGIADIYGRRRTMIMSFAAYIVSFTLFGMSKSLPLLFTAMFFFAVGEAFRSGTHKAMIFTWLRIQGRVSERTKVYGYTRSWSQFGAAASVVISAAFVFAGSGYSNIFYLSIVPYIIGIINFLGYPKELDGEPAESVNLSGVARVLKDTIAASVRRAGLRRLLAESMGFEGVFSAAGDYLQPVLKSAALPLTAAFVASRALGDQQKTALLVGPVYFALYLISGFASRRSHALEGRAGGEDRAAALLWFMNFTVFAALLPALIFRIYPLMVIGFVALHVLQNYWRPVQISRFDSQCDESQGATVLSIESQAKSIATMITAPLLGRAVDAVNAGAGRQDIFWPVGVLGLAVTAAFVVSNRRRRRGE